LKISILQRGGNKDNHPILESATRYFAKQLMSTRMNNTLSIRIEMRTSKLGKDALGSCSTASIGSKSNKEFTIMVQRDSEINEQLVILAHEMVHVQQKAMNTLQYRLWKSDKKYHTRWNGKDAGLFDEIPYAERPWEIEAFAQESVLKKAFVNHFKGNLDREKQRLSEFKSIQKQLMNKRKEGVSLELSA